MTSLDPYKVKLKRLPLIFSSIMSASLPFFMYLIVKRRMSSFRPLSEIPSDATSIYWKGYSAVNPIHALFGRHMNRSELGYAARTWSWILMAKVCGWCSTLSRLDALGLLLHHNVHYVRLDMKLACFYTCLSRKSGFCSIRVILCSSALASIRDNWLIQLEVAPSVDTIMDFFCTFQGDFLLTGIWHTFPTVCLPIIGLWDVYVGIILSNFDTLCSWLPHKS